MIKKTSVLAAIVGLAALGVAAAQASSSSKTYTVKQSGDAAVVKTDGPANAPPEKGKYTILAGTLNGSPGGDGAIVEDNTFTSNFGPTGASLAGTTTFFEPDGSYSGASSGTATPHGGTSTVTITKGNGVYKGVTGKVTVAGTGMSAAITITGSIKGGAGAARASAAKANHAVKQSGGWAIVKTNNLPLGSAPQQGKYTMYAGILSGVPGGNGAIIFNQIFAGVFGPSGVPVTGTVTFFEPQGSYSGSVSGTNTPHGGKASVKITKGAGLYKGATGTLTLTEGNPGTISQNNPQAFKITGSIKY